MRKYIIIILFFLINGQTWESSFSAGNFDINNNFMGGSEVLQLTSHKNQLFASVGYWQDESNIWYGGNNSNYGWAQIINLNNPDGQWSVDLNMDSYYLRPEILKQVIFTKDLNGDILDNPDTLLIAAAFSTNFIFGPVIASAFIRNDQNDSWNISTIYEGELPTGDESYSIRDMQVYTDQITGLEQIFISVGTKGIFSGTYNPNLEEKIQWNPVPEIGSLGVRPLGITIANNNLYFSSGSKIFKRNDGFNPSYSIAHDFSDLEANINPAVGGVRGLSTIENLDNESMLLMWCPNSQSKGLIYRLDPNLDGTFNRVYETKIALHIQDYLPGATSNYVLGAYNEFYKVVNSENNEYYHIIGFESTIQGGDYPTWNGYYSGAMYVLRDSNAEYSIHEVNNVANDNDPPLVATRCYVESPFENENVLYFGGFDPNGNISTNNAWIFKKIFSLLGDINEDEVLNVQDIILIVNFVLTNFYNDNADLNSDGTINVLDIIDLINIILN
ncbi:MAG: hypothetical protein ACJZ03_03565 [Candidatus Neomarinimicrobiota bacterium]